MYMPTSRAGYIRGTYFSDLVVLIDCKPEIMQRVKEGFIIILIQYHIPPVILNSMS